MVGRRAVPARLAAAFVSFAAFLGAFVVPVTPRAQALGLLTGKVTDAEGQLLPGVEVIVAGENLERTVVTGLDGRYLVHELPLGTYTARAVMTGFKIPVASDVVISTAVPRQLDFTLQIACVSEVVQIDPGLASAVREANVILHIRIQESGSAQSCPTTAFCVCTDHLAVTERILKVDERTIPPTAVRFLQEGAGGFADEPPRGGEKPYAPGQEYVAFLAWDREADRFVRSSGPLYMFPVRDGRVHFGRTIAPGVPESLPIERFERLLDKFQPARIR